MLKNGDPTKNELPNTRTLRAGQGSDWVNHKVARSATKVIYSIETGEQITMKLGRVTMVVTWFMRMERALSHHHQMPREQLQSENFGLGMVHQTFRKVAKLQKPKPKLLPL